MTLNLKGLKIAWIGFLLSLIGGVISGIGAPKSNGTVVATTSAGSVIGGILAIVAVILTIVGLSMLKDVSDYYRKSRNYMIIQLIVGIVFVALLMGLVVTKLLSGGGLGAGAIVLCIIILAILAIVGILFYKYLLQGCEETAMCAGDADLAEKSRKLWKLYIIGFVIVIAGAVVMLIGMSVALSNATPESMLLVGATNIKAMVPGAIILVVGTIISLVFTILLLVRMAKICAYDGKTIEDSATKEDVDVENI